VTYGAIALRTARDHFKDGHTLYFAGEYSEAAVELSNAIRLDPEDGETWFALGCAYFKLQDYSRAIECLARGLQRNSAFKEKEIEGCERFPQEGAIFLSAHLGSIIFELSKYHILFLDSRLHHDPKDIALNPELIF
jgi:tetratricopeptide (TPR) repeat protein